MRSLLAAIAAPALIVPFLVMQPAHAASTWTVPKGVDVELSTGAVGAMTSGKNGEIFVAGNFVTSDRANPTAFRIGVWNGRILTPLESPPAGFTADLAYDKRSGVLYAGGLYMVGTTVYGVMKWDGSTWTGIADLGDYGSVFALALAGDGTLYVGGAFSTVNDLPYAGNIARYSPVSGWSSMGSFDGDVDTLAVDSIGRVYAGGDLDFGSVAMWDGTEWSVLGASNGMFRSLLVGPGNVLYGTGTFTEVDGFAAQIVKIRPGVDTAWQRVSTSPLSIPAYSSSKLGMTPRGELMIGVNGRVQQLSAGRWKAIPGDFQGPISVLHSDRSGGLLVGGAFVSVDRVRMPGLAYRSTSSAPSAPRTVAAEDLGRRILVQWSAVSSTPAVTRYEAECRKGSARDVQKLLVRGRFATFDVNSGGSYRCRVRAQNTAGWSPWSQSVTVAVR